MPTTRRVARGLITLPTSQAYMCSTLLAGMLAAAMTTMVAPTTGLAAPAVERPRPGEFGRASVVAAIEAMRRGQPIVVTDDESRENEGDLILAGELATAETVGFVVRHSSGVICVALPGERCDDLRLPPMVSRNQDPKGTAFTVSVDLKAGTTTGISAAERAATFRALADPVRPRRFGARAAPLPSGAPFPRVQALGPEAFNRPGHVFPLRARAGGVLERDGHTEAQAHPLWPTGGKFRAPSPRLPRRRGTSAGWRGCSRRACCAKWSTTTAAWRALARAD